MCRCGVCSYIGCGVCEVRVCRCGVCEVRGV